MKKILFFTFLSAIVIEATCQTIIEERLLSVPENWVEGKVMLENGDLAAGLISFNEITNTISLKQNDEIETITARSAAGFELDNGKRYFSFEFDVNSQLKRAVFCEILKEYEDFIVFSRKDPLQTLDSKGSQHQDINLITGINNYKSKKTVIQQTEIIYFSNGAENIQPYLQITVRDSDRLLYDNTAEKNRVINKNLLAEYMSGKWRQLKAFADKHDLRLDEKQGLMDLLNFYDQLVSN